MKSTLLIGAVILAVMFPVGYNMVYSPQQAKLHAIQQQMAKEQANQQAQIETDALLRQLEQERIRLPKEPNPSWLVSEAVALGEKAGLQLTNISQEPNQALGPYTRLAISLEFSASYHQLGTFLDRVEQSPSYIRVETLTVAPNPNHQELAQIKLILSTAYVPPIMGVQG